MKGLDHQFTNIISTLRQKISDLNNPIINHVGYRLFLKNGKTIGFSTNLSWNSFLENYNFTTELSAHYKAELCNIISNNFKYYIRSSKLGVTSPFIKALDKFKLGTSLIIYKKSCNKIEGFYFITSNDTNDVFNFYLNKISVFNYFIDIASPLIGSILEKPLYDNLYSRIFTEKDSLVLFPCRDILIKAKGLSVDYLGKSVYLTPRELECILLLTMGKSSKSIASKLNISPATVNKHFENLRTKLGFNSRGQIIEFAYNNYLNTIFTSTKIYA